jgi:hypothetical protein
LINTSRGKISRLQRYTNNNKYENLVSVIPMKKPRINRKKKSKRIIIKQRYRTIGELRYKINTRKNKMTGPVIIAKISSFSR